MSDCESDSTRVHAFVSSRVITFTGEVNSFAFSYLSEALAQMAEAGGKNPVTLVINSLGGDSGQGLSIYDLIRNWGPIDIHGCGDVMSAAALILQAGQVRLLSKNATVLVHDGELTLSGTPAQVESQFKNFKRERAIYHRILHSRIKEKHPDYPEKDVAEMLKRECYLSAAETVRLGLADGILKEHECYARGN